MTAFLRRADDVLRGASWTTRSSGAVRPMTVLVVVFGLLYGAVMGSFGGFAPDRLVQLLYSAIKVPLLLQATALLSLPSFFVLNTLFGVRADFPRALRALVASQAGLTILLAATAPLTLLWYASSADYSAAILFNALMFASASLGAQLLLRRAYRPLIAANPRHRLLLRAWLVIYAFVGVQMGWLLRPFVGAPGEPIQFFRPDSWGNAYVIVAEIVRRQWLR